MPDTSTEVAIATTTLGSAASTITFNSIPSTYTDFRLVLVAKGTTPEDVFIQFNGDTATNYSRTLIRGNGSAAASVRETSQARIVLGINSLDTTYFSIITADVFSYTGSTNKTLLSEFSQDVNSGGMVGRTVGLWRNTAAITSLTLSLTGTTTYAAGTTATLYGIL
jgi:hypothetical protein